MRRVVLAMVLLASSTACASPADLHMRSVARRVFPGACWPARVVVMPLSAGDGHPIWSASDRVSCTVWLSPDAIDLPWAGTCSLLMHEYGHLAGFIHSENPRSVMYAVYLHDDPRCEGHLGIYGKRPRRGRPRI